MAGSMSTKVFFTDLSSDLTSVSRVHIAKFAALLKQHNYLQVLVEGHILCIGYVLCPFCVCGLSTRRANAVRHALVTDGVEQERIYARGLGGCYAPSDGVDAKRVEFYLLSPDGQVFPNRRERLPEIPRAFLSASSSGRVVPLQQVMEQPANAEVIGFQ